MPGETLWRPADTAPPEPAPRASATDERTLDLSRDEVAAALALALNSAAAARVGHEAQAPQHDDAPLPGDAASRDAGTPRAADASPHAADADRTDRAESVAAPAARKGAPVAPRIEVESTFMPSTGAGFTSSELREAGETLIRFPATAVHVATDVGLDMPSTPVPITSFDEPAFVREADRAARWRSAPVRALLLLVLLVGTAAALLQAAFLYRNEVVAWQPAVKPLLASVCAQLGCRIEPLHRIQDVLIDSHSLARTDTGYELSVLLKNRAHLANAFPNIELTLTDLTDMPIVRRVVTPADYLARPADAATGVPALGEYKAVVRFDTQGVPVTGYRLIVFYP